MIKFYNIKTGESRVCETEPMIAAFWASSDRGPNSNAGQDFGWRLAPETILEIGKIQKDPTAVRDIAAAYRMLPEEVTESDVLKYISDKSSISVTGMDQSEEDFEHKYEDDIRAIRARLENEDKVDETTSKVVQSEGKKTNEKKESTNVKSR